MAFIINVTKWIEENKAFFLPPVCNKLMHGAGQLKIMFIGGPNQRKDYHLEEGEEFFMQIKGDMVLKVVEKGVHKDISIKEGEVFLLPSRIPHSPQRVENTVGLVIERERSQEENDGLRYYVEGTTKPLWEKWFYCSDLGVQLGPIIKEYFASEEHKSGQPPEGKVFDDPPFPVDESTVLVQPFSLKQWLAESKNEICQQGSKVLFGSGEFKIVVNGEGNEECQNEGETFIWQLEGEADISCSRGSAKMGPMDCVLLTAGEKYSMKRRQGAVAITITTDPTANKLGH